MRTVINVVRGKSVPDALSTLNFLPQQVTDTVKTTIMSAVHNLMDRNPDERFEESQLVVSEIKVDEDASQRDAMLKRTGGRRTVGHRPRRSLPGGRHHPVPELGHRPAQLRPERPIVLLHRVPGRRRRARGRAG